MKLIKICPICSTQLSTYQNSITCSRKCAALNQRGSNNSNFGKKWSNEKKKSQSDLIKSKVDDKYREIAGSANRGVKFSQERIDAMHGHKDSASYSHPHSEETKLIIGQKSSDKFTDEYLQRQREQFVKLGYWVSDDQKDDFEIYHLHSSWITDMWYLSDKNLLENLGIFNSRTNRSGLVRDHRLSRKFGFDNEVFPEILRHPENCDIISHSANSRKKEKSSLTIEELFHKIENTNHEWKEQEMVLKLITDWRSGKRFSANDYRRKSHVGSISDI